MSLLNVEHLTHGFGDRAIFDDVSFRLLKGEHIGLVGANGEGKSTFMNIVTGKLMPDEVIDTVRFITIGSTHGYRPKPVRRKEIPKPYDPTKTRPLGIPCVWDRLVQQCIKQVMEPICEAKFHERNNGFRPYRSTQNAIAQCYKMAQLQNLHFVVDVDIVGFFDNIDHSKLIRQLWGIGIQDRKLIMIIKQMLKAEILFNDIIITPETGTPQGGFYPHFLQMLY